MGIGNRMRQKGVRAQRKGRYRARASEHDRENGAQLRPMSSGLEEFKRMLSEYAQLSLWAAGGSLVIPFVASFLSIIPPWPSGLNVITSVIQLVTLAISYQNASQNKREVGRAMRSLAFAGFIMLLIYMGAF